MNNLYQRAIESALSKIEGNIPAFTNKFPGDTTVKNRYHDRPATSSLPAGSNYGWTTSFWTGMLWLAYELTGKNIFKETGKIHTQSFENRFLSKTNIDTHDLGFLYSLSCVADYKLTGSANARKVALGAAEHLMTRFWDKPGIFQAWGTLDDPKQKGRTIVDCLMNMPLLYWASRETQNPSFADAAYRHELQMSRTIVRPDSSTYHTYYYDTDTGKPCFGDTHQGLSDESCWSRGQAWAVYGFTFGYVYTKDTALLSTACNVADYFLAHLPSDHVAYWDFTFSEGSGEERDSSASSIAACGLLELCRWLEPGERKQKYLQAAESMLVSMINQYSTINHPESNALLLHGVQSKPAGRGIDEASLWGDYFYFEALVRATQPTWKMYW